MLEGVVKDPKGAVVTGAVVSVRPADGSARAYNAKTDKNGKFIIIGIYPTEYNISAAHEANNLESPPARMRLPAGRMSNVELLLADKAAIAAAAAAATPARKGRSRGARQAGQGLRRRRRRRQRRQPRRGDRRSSTRPSALMPTCGVCYKNIGFAYTQKKDYDQAEAAYKKAIEIQPRCRCLQRPGQRLQRAEEVRAGGRSEREGRAGHSRRRGRRRQCRRALRPGREPLQRQQGGEAKAAFQSAVKANPNHSEAHYMLGLVLVGEGDTKGALAPSRRI